MKTPITYKTLRNYAYSNDQLIRSSVKGIVLDFTGLGTQEMIWNDNEMHHLYARKGIIYVKPYYNPWS